MYTRTCILYVIMVSINAHACMCHCLYLPILLILLCLCIVHIILFILVYVQPTVLAAPQEPLFGIRFVLREIIVTKEQTSMYSAQRIFADFAAGWGKYVTKLCTHVYTLSELLSHIWSELGSLCWIRPSFGDGTTRSNQIFHLLHIYAC